MKSVVLLTIDTLRKDVLGCYGSQRGVTPFLDSLQSHCLRFENAYSGGSYTQAAFPGILTSSHYLQYPKRKKLSPERTLVSTPLKKAGITTAAFHSNPYLCGFFGWNRDWDTFYDSMMDDVTDECPYIKADVINRKVKGWLGSRTDPNTPFFLWTHYMDVHEPYVPEKQYMDAIDPSLDPSREKMMDLFQNVVLKRDVSDKNTVELLRKLYLAHVKEIDDAVKTFFGILEEAGVLENSIVIITADHGDEFGEHGGLSHDGKMYDELVNVPLLVYDADRTEPMVSDTIVSTLDIAPTVLNLLNVDPVEGYLGQPLLPLDGYTADGAYGEAVDKHGSQEQGEEKRVCYYRKGDLKIIHGERDNLWELYHLKDDPKEKNNIVETHPAAEDMKAALRERLDAGSNT